MDISRRYTELFLLGWLGRAYLVAPPLFQKFAPAVFRFTPYDDSQVFERDGARYVTLMESSVVARGIPFHLKLDDDDEPSLLGIGCDISAATAQVELATGTTEAATRLCERINADASVKRRVVRAVSSTIFRRLTPVAKATKKEATLEASAPPLAFSPRRDVWAREGSSEKWCQQVSGYYFAQATVQDVRFTGAEEEEAAKVRFAFYLDETEPLNSDDPYRNINPEVIYCAFDEDSDDGVPSQRPWWRRLRGGGCGGNAMSRRLIVRASAMASAPLAHALLAGGPLAAAAPPLTSRGIGYESDDGALAFRLPPRWRVVSTCSPSRPTSTCRGEDSGRRVVVRGERDGGGATATATVDLGAYGKRLGEWATLEQVRDDYRNRWPLASRGEMRCTEARAETSKGGTPRYYVLRFEGSRGGVRLVKIGVQQSRLYMLTLDAAAAAGGEALADLDSVMRSFEAFPVSSLRGGLLSSSEPAVLRCA